MATAVVMPKLGNSVETSIIVNWKKKKGEHVSQGEALCEIETDKATMDVESPVSGTLLETFFQEGDEVPVMINIAAVGEPGESVDDLWPASATRRPEQTASGGTVSSAPVQQASAPNTNGRDIAASVVSDVRAAPGEVEGSKEAGGISPRAKNLAASKSLDMVGIEGTGPGGRIIERDIQAALANRQRITPLAKSMLAKGDFVAPPQGTGTGGRITSKDLIAPAQAAAQPAIPAGEGDVTVIPIKGTRKVIATRMLNSMQTTAQLTLNASADARAILEYRKRLKASPDKLGLQDVTINDLLLFVVSRTLLQYPDLNAAFANDTITQYKTIHLGFAVDTPRGLIVPVIRKASELNLKQISQEARRLAAACQDGSITLDDLNGGTFTVTNLGSLGIESFTPVLNVPQVGILGVGNVNLKPVEVDGEVAFIPHLGLSLTINHQVVDGAPGARFLQTLTKNLAELELILAL